MTTIRIPSVPYLGPICGRFTPGSKIIIQGITPSIAYSFSIYLQCGSTLIHRDDVALQMIVQILDKCIKLNSVRNGIVGEEQTGVTCPIQHAKEFEIILMCDINQYKVTINGQHYCNFPKRIQHNDITHLAIDGDVSIIRIAYESSSSVPPSAPIALSEALIEDLEMINSIHATAPMLPRIQPTSTSDSLPPSYEEAVNPSQQGSPCPIRAPYPTGGAPYPTGGAPYPIEDPPYPTGDAYPPGMPRPTGTGGRGTDLLPGPLAYPQDVPYPTGTGGRGTDLLLGPSTGPFRLEIMNSAELPASVVIPTVSNNKDDGAKAISKCCGFILVIIIAAVVLFIKLTK